MTTIQRWAAIGEAMIECRPDADRRLQYAFAGDTLNTTVYFARFMRSHGISIYYATALGTDVYSDAMIQEWQTEGIHCGYVKRLPNHLPGLYFIQTDAHGERSFYYYRAQSAAREMLAHEHHRFYDALATMDVLYLSGITLAILPPSSRKRLLKLLTHAKANHSIIIFDPNYRSRLWENASIARDAMQAVAPLIDMVLPTFSDEATLFGDLSQEACAMRWHQWGVQEVIVKNDIEPCFYLSRQEGCGYVPARVVESVVDTTAAGDSFNAGFLAARFSGIALRDAIVCGHHLASIVVQHPGAIIPKEYMPTLTRESLVKA